MPQNMSSSLLVVLINHVRSFVRQKVILTVYLNLLFFCFQLWLIFIMASLAFILGVLGNITTGLVYLSPTKTFWRIVKHRSTEDFESIPYVFKLLNAYCWVYYGLIKPNSILVATVNMFGAVAELVYVTIFLIYAPPSMRARTAILFGTLEVGFPAGAILVTQFLLHGDVQISVAGAFCVVFSMISYGSPLSAMKTVVITKSVEYMPFLLSLSLFVNGGIWTLYALLTKDYFIGVPNGSGFLLGTAQLFLYAIYWKPKSSMLSSNNVENGHQDEPLIPDSGPLSKKS
ncbi:MtN3_slv domain-containing protein [Cephalotus follicularis]|uniref:Bidirectional sugar transporter SWEET n=1 Tax=Cephalotus follicularis TaxID=3775 RepID=A0A1Q3CIA4_CEPFO|nr:MtN3_slv domain-containing protein [Cephalotus follicularis]